MHARTSIHLVALGATLVGATSIACAPAIDLDADVPTSSSHSIRGGLRDSSDQSVVGVVRLLPNAIDLCTGSLIAPNVVLTAHHCVSDVSNAVDRTVSCSDSAFAAPDAPDNFLVTTSTDIPTSASGFHAVTDVIVPGSSTSTHFCGLDVAVLVLAEPLVVTPLTPSVDADLHDGDSYDAIGYGSVDDTGGATGDTAGTRRRLDGLVVECVDGTCNNDPGIDAMREWVGGGGPCQGDSGGPALDAAGRVVGVVSRADDACTSAVYESVFAYASFLRAAATSAADSAGIAPPAWVEPSSQRAPTCSCATSASTRAPATRAALTAIAVVAFISAGFWRRRRP